MGEHYGALWSWAKDHQDFKNMIGKDPPFFNSTTDKERFHNFLKYPRVKGNSIKHFYEGYESEGRFEVDCWVFTDDLQVSLYECLRQYEEQGGILNWDNPIVSNFKKLV